jgi:hypothetical protein
MTCVCFRHLRAVHGSTNIWKFIWATWARYCSFVLSWYFCKFRFNFIFQKTAPFRTLLIIIYISTNRSDILKIVENSTKQPRLDYLSFFLDFVSAQNNSLWISLPPYLLTSSLASFRAIPILFLQFTNSVNESVHMFFVGIIRRTFQAKLNKIITNDVVKT